MPRERPPVRMTVVQLTLEAVRSGVMRGRYAPGQRLIEADLMRELAVSRGVVREVLRRLAAEGLIIIEPYRSAVVARLTREGLADAFRIRELLEVLGASLAAERIGQANGGARMAEKRLRELAVLDPNDADDYMERNYRFHSYIAELSGNAHLPRFLAQLQTPALRSHFPRVVDRDAIKRSNAEHRAVVAAICDRDPARAAQAMRRHVRRTGELSKRLPAFLFSGPGVPDRS
jgi:DNA-binding GntR family transcriptional regulator